MRNGLPVVAIVGRPNVGKSSLFNLMINERKSIVDEMEGVTRDINIEQVDSHGIGFYVYDTAGYLEKGDRFNKLVQQKVRQAVSDAELVLFMVDGQNYHPIDEQLAVFLQQQNKPIIVLTNKLDNEKMQDMAYEFFNLGFENVMPLSIVHRIGIVDLMETIEDKFKDFEVPEELQNQISVAIVGKPNVGKSSLLNTLLGYERSIVSEVPGTTRDSLDDIFHWNDTPIRLVDTAGLRRQAKVNEDIEYYSNVRAVQAIEGSEVVVQLLDASEPISHQDKQISRMVLEKGRALIMAFNKWDLINTGTAEENYDLMKEFTKNFYDEYPEFNFVPLLFISAKDDYKIEKLMDSIVRVYEDYHYRASTAKLNEWLKNDIRESNPNKQVSRLKVYYVTQAHAAPPRFVFFVNSKKHVRKDYPRFIENRLRLAFEFSGVPIKINFREKHEERM